MINSIFLNEKGVLCVKPKGISFNMIYRSATGVHWDNKEKCLIHNPSANWDHMQWFKQMVSAVKEEYGVTLVVTGKTSFYGIDNTTVKAIKNLSQPDDSEF